MDLRSTIRYAIAATAGAAAGIAGSLFFIKNHKQEAPSGHISGGPVAKGPKENLAQRLQFHTALRYGMPDDSVIRAFTDYVVAFDTRTRNPKWVLEHITRDKGRGDANRSNSDFYEDKELDPRLRSKNEHYRGSGYDRGHMAPAGNYKYSQQAMDETFSLLNMSPQVGKGFNRDYWARAEKYVKDLTNHFQDVFIVTGPLFLPSPTPQGIRVNYPVIGQPPDLVAVPTHYYKVVLADNGRGSTAVGAFVMPNAEIAPEVPLTAFVVPVDALERVSGIEHPKPLRVQSTYMQVDVSVTVVTVLCKSQLWSAGIRFFPQYLDRPRRAALDEAALDWQAQGRQQLRLLGPNAQGMPLLTSPGARGALEGPPGAAVQGPAPVPAMQRPGAPPAPTSAPVGPVKGTSHLCDSVSCKLPPVDFFKRSNSFSGSNSSGQGRAARGSSTGSK